MQRFHSILARILVGFLTIVLLQMLMAVFEWGSEVHLQNLADTDIAAEAALAQAYGLSQASLHTNTQIATFLHKGGADERQAVTEAIADVESRVAQIGDKSGPEGQLLANSVGRVHMDLSAVLDAVGHKRAAIDAVRDLVRHGHNTATALAEAASHAPDPETMHLTGVAAATAAEPLSAALIYAIEERPEERRIADEAIQHAKATRASLSNQLIADGDLAPRLNRLNAILGEAVVALEPALNAVTSSMAEQDKTVQELQTDIKTADATIADLVKRLSAERQARQNEMKAARRENRLIALYGTIFACLAGLALAPWVGRSITRPIGRLNAAMRRIADGDLQQAVPDQSRKDEVGAMAKALLALRDASQRARSLDRASCLRILESPGLSGEFGGVRREA